MEFSISMNFIRSDLIAYESTQYYLRNLICGRERTSASSIFDCLSIGIYILKRSRAKKNNSLNIFAFTLSKN